MLDLCANCFIIQIHYKINMQMSSISSWLLFVLKVKWWNENQNNAPNLKEFFDFFCNVHWIGGWCKTIHWLPIFIDQKLGEVPLDCVAKEAALLLFQILVQWDGRVSIDIDLICAGKIENIFSKNIQKRSQINGIIMCYNALPLQKCHQIQLFPSANDKPYHRHQLLAFVRRIDCMGIPKYVNLQCSIEKFTFILF